jgi:hypothetical protein
MTAQGSHTAADAQKVWRYMSFPKFAWLLQKKQLWLARADLLGDPWEISLAGDQLDFVISRHPITPIDDEKIRESAMERSARINKLWRMTTFVSCWNCGDHESNALWRIYCGDTDGVAIQTTFGKLRSSVAPLPLYHVEYGTPGSQRRTPSLPDLVTKKRLMFAYEQEIRVVLSTSGRSLPEHEVFGYAHLWSPEEIVESIRVHPLAQPWFMEVVVATVAQYAPSLRDHIAWSSGRERPPF